MNRDLYKLRWAQRTMIGSYIQINNTRRWADEYKIYDLTYKTECLPVILGEIRNQVKNKQNENTNS